MAERELVAARVSDVVLQPWSDKDLPLLEKILGDPDRMRYLGGCESPEQIRQLIHAFPSISNARSNAICRKLGFSPIEVCPFEYPPGHFMRVNDWRLDLFRK